MSASSPRQAQSARAFIVTPYVFGPDGRPAAQLPSCCPATREPGDAACRLGIDHHRHRMTGPQHRLTVVRCWTHGVAFTLYPPGHVPYRRQPVLKLAPDGKPIHRDAESDCEQTDFDGTLFGPVLDARRRRPLMRDPSQDLPQKPSATHHRHLRLAARLVGVARDLSDRVRLSIATVLSVATLQLREGSRAVGYREMGEAVCGVLARLRGGARRALQLLVCGCLTRSWGEPLHWDAERQVLERSPFVVPATDAAC